METERVAESNHRAVSDDYRGNTSHPSGDDQSIRTERTNDESPRRPLIAIIYDQAESLISSDLDENDKKVLTDNLAHLKQLEIGHHTDQQLVDSSNLGKLQFLKINNDITSGLGNFEFEYGLENEDIDYYFLRLRTHCFYTTACAHAAYFIGVANSIRWASLDLMAPRNRNFKFFLFAGGTWTRSKDPTTSSFLPSEPS